MRLWYQSFARSDRFTRYATFLRDLAGAGLPGDVEIDVFCVPREAGHADHQFRYWELVDSRDVVSNALRAQEEGYAAYLIGNILDPALHHAREIVDIPVLGLCDTAITAACTMGRTYGFVTINEQQAYRIEQNIRDHGTRDRFRGLVSLGIDDYPSIDESYAGEAMQQFVRRFSSHAEELARKGVEVVIPGGGVVMGLLARTGLTRVGSVPVVDGIRTLAAYGAASARLWKLHGHYTSKRLAYAGPGEAALAEIRETRAGHLLEAPLGRPDA